MKQHVRPGSWLGRPWVCQRPNQGAGSDGPFHPCKRGWGFPVQAHLVGRETPALEILSTQLPPSILLVLWVAGISKPLEIGTPDPSLGPLCCLLLPMDGRCWVMGQAKWGKLCSGRSSYPCEVTLCFRRRLCLLYILLNDIMVTGKLMTNSLNHKKKKKKSLSLSPLRPNSLLGQSTWRYARSWEVSLGLKILPWV